MPETFTFAGKTYPRSAAIAVGAAAAAIAGYAWFTRRDVTEEPPAELLVPEEPTGILPFSGTTSGTFRDGPEAFRNDQEWFQAALDKLMFDYGTGDTPTASDALNRYLTSKPLTATQVPMINFVINTIGPPPSGARTIRQETTPGGTTQPPPSATKPGKVTSHRASASRTEIRTNWSPPATGTPTSYKVTVYQGVQTSAGVRRQAVWSTSTTSRDVRTGGRFRPAHPYDVGVVAVGAGGAGPESFVHVRTMK